MCGGTFHRRNGNDKEEGLSPRVRGTLSLATLSMRAWGLSPRVRGNHASDGGDNASTGSIPACAGEPDQRPPTTSLSPVYPRVCGGTVDVELPTGQGRGLSPRVRGNLDTLISRLSTIGSIPACAGEPKCSPGRRGRPRVYPRVCGGTIGSALTLCLYLGLSPRVRGNRPNQWFGRHPTRSIPACAGEPA